MFLRLKCVEENVANNYVEKIQHQEMKLKSLLLKKLMGTRPIQYLYFIYWTLKQAVRDCIGFQKYVDWSIDRNIDLELTSVLLFYWLGISNNLIITLEQLLFTSRYNWNNHASYVCELLIMNQMKNCFWQL